LTLSRRNLPASSVGFPVAFASVWDLYEPEGDFAKLELPTTWFIQPMIGKLNEYVKPRWCAECRPGTAIVAVAMELRLLSAGWCWHMACFVTPTGARTVTYRAYR
jgi:hypothetical protein